MSALPITFLWTEIKIIDEDGVILVARVMNPLRRFADLAARQFEIGGEYSLIVKQQRSRKSHNFYFASIADGYANLPEDIKDRWPTSEHMRKWLLIEAGFCNEREFDFEGHNADAQARKLGTFIRSVDRYAQISIHSFEINKVKVIVRCAKSQAMSGPAAMSVEEFKASTRAVLELLDELIGVPKGTLMRVGGRYA